MFFSTGSYNFAGAEVTASGRDPEGGSFQEARITVAHTHSFPRGALMLIPFHVAR